MKHSMMAGFLAWMAASALSVLCSCRPGHCNTMTQAGSGSMAADTAASAAPADSGSQKKKTYPVRLAMTGDIMPGTTFPDSTSRTHLPADDGERLFRHVAPILGAADAAFGNLETTLLDSGGSLKKYKDPKTFYAFRTPTGYAHLLAEAGFDALSIANNHTNDFGEEGRRSTRKTMDGISLAYAGHSPMAETAVFERNGITFGFCAFSVSPLTPDLRDSAMVRRIICSLRGKCRILAVSFHGGSEGLKHRHLPFAKETYLGRDQGDVVRFARTCIDCGADIVFGHGPHLPRALELYRGHLIAYSLGNFCTPYRVSLKNQLGYAPILTADLDEKGLFTGGRIHSFVQQPGRGPLPDSLSRAAKDIRMLTESDFPRTPLRIHPDGRIETTRR